MAFGKPGLTGSRGVKAYAACCLADILRVYAPDAPYTGDELRVSCDVDTGAQLTRQDIFQFFHAQLHDNLKTSPSQPKAKPLQPSRSRTNEPSLTQPTLSSITQIPYFGEYSYLLNSLSEIKSVVLVCDVPGSEELMTSYFDSFVSIVK